MGSARVAGSNEAIFTYGGASRDYTGASGISTWEADPLTANLTTGIWMATVSNNSVARFKLGETLNFTPSGVTGVCFGQNADRSRLYFTTAGVPQTTDSVGGVTSLASCDIDTIPNAGDTGVSLVLECHPDSASYDLGGTTHSFGGCTTNATYRRIIRPVSGSEHKGIPGAGLRFENVRWAVSEIAFSIYDIELNYVNPSATAERTVLTHSGSASVSFVGLLVHAVGAGLYPYHGIINSTTAGGFIVDCIVYGCDGDGITARSAKVYNCTSIGNRYNYTYTGSDSATYVNNIAQHGTSAGWNGTGAAANNNLTSDLTAPGTSSVQGADLTFVNAAAYNYHLADGDAAAIGAGADLHADASFPFNDDIDLVARPDGAWDIGADEATILLRVRPTLFYNAGRLAVFQKTIDLLTDTLKARLVSSGYTADATHATMASTSAYQIGTDTTLTGKSIEASGDSLTAFLKADNLTTAVVAAGSTIGGVVVYKDGGNDAASIPIAYYHVVDQATGDCPVTVPWGSDAEGGVMPVEFPA